MNITRNYYDAVTLGIRYNYKFCILAIFIWKTEITFQFGCSKENK